MPECTHDFVGPSVDPRRHCKKCGIVGRGTRDKEGRPLEEGHFEMASRERSELFGKLRSPIQQRDHLKGKG